MNIIEFKEISLDSKKVIRTDENLYTSFEMKNINGFHLDENHTNIYIIGKSNSIITLDKYRLVKQLTLENCQLKTMHVDPFYNLTLLRLMNVNFQNITCPKIPNLYRLDIENINIELDKSILPNLQIFNILGECSVYCLFQMERELQLNHWLVEKHVPEDLCQNIIDNIDETESVVYIDIANFQKNTICYYINILCEKEDSVNVNRKRFVCGFNTRGEN